MPSATVAVPTPTNASPSQGPAFTLSDSLIIVATLLGPILAVQAQKLVEVLRERRQRKLWVFQTLMATRMARVSGEHVQALNMIDLTFYGGRSFGRIRTKKEQAVIDSWREYLDNLTEDPGETPETLYSRRHELFINLLHNIAKDVGFDFNRVELNKGVYSPVAHSELEREQAQVRTLALELLSGQTSLNMNVVGLPIDEAAMKAQRDLFNAQLAAFTGKSSLSIKLQPSEPHSEEPTPTE